MNLLCAVSSLGKSTRKNRAVVKGTGSKVYNVILFKVVTNCILDKS